MAVPFMTPQTCNRKPLGTPEVIFTDILKVVSGDPKWITDHVRPILQPIAL